MLPVDFHQQQPHCRHDSNAAAVPRASGSKASSQPAWAAAGAKTSIRSMHAEKLRSLSELLAKLAQDCDRDLPQGDHNTAAVLASSGNGSSSSGVPVPSMMELIGRVECAVNDLAAAFKCHQHASDGDGGLRLITTPTGYSPAEAGQNARIGRSSQRPNSTGSPRSRSVTPRPALSSQPMSASSPSPPSRVNPHTYSASPTLPETPTRPPPSASDLALERSLASLSIDASAVDTIHDPHPASPSLAAAAAAAAKSKSKSARTSSQLTPSSAVHPPKRSRQSMTPPSRPRFSLGVFTSTSGVSFVRTPVNLASPTRSHRASPSPGTMLVPECTPPRPESLHHPDPRSRTSNRRATASPTPAPRTKHVSDGDDDDDDPIVLISSTPGPNPPRASTAQRTVVILSDSDSDASPPPFTKRAPPPAIPAQRTPRRPAVRLTSDSDSDAEAAPTTPTRRAPARVFAGTPRNTPRRAGGAMQRKIEILRTRFTPRRDEGGASGVRRKAVVVDSDEDDDGEEEEEGESDGGVSGVEEADGEDDWWSGDGQDDEDTYDSSFIDDSGDDDDQLNVSRPKPKIRETPETPRLPAPPATPALTSAAFKRARDTLTAQAFAEFNERAFNNQLPSNLAIEWNKRLCTTAGRAWPKRFKPTTKQPVPPERKLADDGWVYDARVELSVKVLDSEEKLRRTLLHELCHVAAWLLDHVAKPPHGPRFWFWAKRATRAFPALEVTTCHDYEINFKYTYVCTVCGYSFGRHSKSVDVGRQACGACNGGLLRLEVAGGKKRDGADGDGGQVKSARKPSAYQVFVKERYGQVKQAGGAVRSHKEVMQVLSEMWAKEGKGKGAAVDAAKGAPGCGGEGAVDGQEDGDGSMAAA